MLAIHLELEGDGAWKDLQAHPERIIHLGNDTMIRIATLEAGMKSGAPSLAIRIDLPDGRTVIAETSVRLFLGIARIIAARHPGAAQDSG